MSISYEVLLPGIPASSQRGALGWCSVVLIKSRDKTILFDTGSYGDRSYLLEQLASRRLNIKDIDIVFLSHFHFDHAVNAELFTESSILMSEQEMEYVSQEGYKRSNDPYVPVSQFASLRHRLTAITEDQYIAEGIRTVSLPGHTPGNMGLLLESDRVVLAGDAVKNAWEFVRNVAPPSFHSQQASLENYEKVKSLATIVIPGHDNPFQLLDEGRIRYTQHWSAEISFYGNPYEDVRVLRL